MEEEKRANQDEDNEEDNKEETETVAETAKEKSEEEDENMNYAESDEQVEEEARNEDEKDDDEEEEKEIVQDPNENMDATIFLRNLSFDTSESELFNAFKAFGKIQYIRIVYNRDNGLSKGCAFIKFQAPEGMNNVFAHIKQNQAMKEAVASKKPTATDGPVLLSTLASSGIMLGGRELIVSKALNQKQMTELSTEKVKEDHDKRNLYLLEEGRILRGSAAAAGIKEEGMLRREEDYRQRLKRLENPMFFVSRKRLAVRNLPKAMQIKGLRELFLNAVVGEYDLVGDDSGDKAAARQKKASLVHIKQAKIVTDRVTNKSKGYGFVEFQDHKHALIALRKINNNPNLLPGKRRLQVEFAVENSNILKLRNTKRKQFISNTPKREQRAERAAPANSSNTPNRKRKRGTVPVDSNPRGEAGRGERAPKRTKKQTGKAKPGRKKANAAEERDLVESYKKTLFSDSSLGQTKRWFD
eukprot:TRINITY_DN20045_c0_g1_i1.p1 TRINITY_DN20045_c0_g1~~TRINITY_DN20045_c0_g1_i1.p1  ORF type:complete len:471 (-),score=142.45 TRINITY_DN20045_c0_g1_i1:42-1454(-)